MDVRFGHVRDPQAILRRGGDIRLRIPVGVNDDRFASPLAADQIARLGEALVVESLQQQTALLAT
jgi:hypothetical protein